MFAVIAVGMFLCGVAGCIVGGRNDAAGMGFFLGLILGPIGVIAAFALDNRLQCDNCGGRLNGQPRVCPHCNVKLTFPGKAKILPEPTAADVRAELEYVERMRQKRLKDGH